MRQVILNDLPVSIETGDILSATTEAIAVTANPNLQLTGGIGAGLVTRAGDSYQTVLDQAARKALGRLPAVRGSILVMPGTPLSARFVFHVVSIDVFYRTTAEVLSGCTRDCLLAAHERGCDSLALPAFATGYGRFGLDACARAMASGIVEARGRLTAPPRLEIWLRDRLRAEAFLAGWPLSGAAWPPPRGAGEDS